MARPGAKSPICIPCSSTGTLLSSARAVSDNSSDKAENAAVRQVEREKYREFLKMLRMVMAPKLV